jgi:hypothetical protein
MKTKAKMFHAYWSNDFCNAGTRQVGEGFFTIEHCYSADDIAAIGALEVDDVWKSQHYGSAHTVTRIT